VNLPLERLKTERFQRYMEIQVYSFSSAEWIKQGGTTEARPFRPLWMKGSFIFSQGGNV
jgi:hypothetical protein